MYKNMSYKLLTLLQRQMTKVKDITQLISSQSLYIINITFLMLQNLLKTHLHAQQSIKLFNCNFNLIIFQFIVEIQWADVKYP